VEQRIRFCRSSDGVTIAYAEHGAGPPIVKSANWMTHLEYDWGSPVWRHWLDELGNRQHFVRYDQRGCGLSDREVDELSLDSFVADLEAVVDAARLKRFALLGLSQGAAIAIAFAVRHPERVSHLVLCGGYARGRLRRALTAEQRDEALLLEDIVRVGWGRRTPFSGGCSRPDSSPTERRSSWSGSTSCSASRSVPRRRTACGLAGAVST
jgi:pimeloyl-ACP methyl ester carboxylesterase